MLFVFFNYLMQMYNLFYTKQIKNLILYNKKRILCERGLKLNNDQKQSQKLFKTKYFTNIELPYTVKNKIHFRNLHPLSIHL